MFHIFTIGSPEFYWKKTGKTEINSNRRKKDESLINYTDKNNFY